MARRSLPCVTLAAIVAVAAPLSAHAQPSDADASMFSDQARTLYLEAVVAYRKGNFAKAHTSFLAAWTLKRHWQIAANLADCELRLERWRAAAEHADYYLRNAPIDRRARAQALVDKTAAHVAARTVAVSEPGAHVNVDGKPLDSPDGPLFLEPGHHIVEATKGARRARAEFDAVAGTSEAISLTLPESEAPLAPSASRLAPEAPLPRPTKSSALIATGVGLGVVGVAVGIVGLVASANNAARFDELDRKLAPGGSSACSLPANAADCDALTSAYQAKGDFRTLGAIGLAVGGASLVATVVYIALPAGSSQSVGLSVGPGSASWTMRGTF